MFVVELEGIWLLYLAYNLPTMEYCDVFGVSIKFHCHLFMQKEFISSLYHYNDLLTPLIYDCLYLKGVLFILLYRY